MAEEIEQVNCRLLYDLQSWRYEAMFTLLTTVFTHVVLHDDEVAKRLLSEAGVNYTLIRREEVHRAHNWVLWMSASATGCSRSLFDHCYIEILEANLESDHELEQVYVRLPAYR